MVHNFFLVRLFRSIFSNLYTFRATICPSSGETTLFMLGTCYSVWNPTPHTRQSSIQNNKYQVSHKYRCFSWWWKHTSPKRI